MIAPLQLVKGMPLNPCACVCCGGNPVDENTGEAFENVFVPGVDINWGDSVYICHACCEIIADLKGRVTREGFDKLEVRNQKLQDKYDRLATEHEKAESLLSRITEGKNAVKEAKGRKVAA